MRIICVPDTQIRTGVPLEHLKGLGHYLLDKAPDVIVMIGDWWDMPSLSQHNPRSHIDFEGKRFKEDIDAGNHAMDVFLAPMNQMNRLRKKNKKALWKPRMVFCMGNHENRRERLLDQEPYLRGALQDFPVEQYGWERHAFLKPVRIEGVNFSHYAASTVGRALSSARSIAQKKHESWIVGHYQHLDIYIDPFTKTDGGRVQCVIAGAFYQHHESYKTPQDNEHWRGALLLNEVRNGSFDICTLSVDYLKESWS